MLEQIRIDDPQQLSVMTGRPPLPGQLKIAGYANLVVGPLLAIVNLILVGRSISELERINAPDGLSVFFEVNIGMFCVLGVFLVIGGIGLLCNQRWGRILSLITGVLCVLSAMIAAVMNKVMENLLTSGAIPLPARTAVLLFQRDFRRSWGRAAIWHSVNRIIDVAGGARVGSPWPRKRQDDNRRSRRRQPDADRRASDKWAGNCQSGLLNDPVCPAHPNSRIDIRNRCAGKNTKVEWGNWRQGFCHCRNNYFVIDFAFYRRDSSVGIAERGIQMR